MSWRVTYRPSELDFLVDRLHDEDEETPFGPVDDSLPLVVVRPRLEYREEGRCDAELVARVIAKALDAGLAVCEDCGALCEAPGPRCGECADAEQDIPALGPQPTEPCS